MKKSLFTTLAMAGMAIIPAIAEIGVTETWTATTDVMDNTVTLTSIQALFLNNTSKGSNAGNGTWEFKSTYAYADDNGCEIQFTTTSAGKLEISFQAGIAYNKSLNMYVNGDTNDTMDATYTDDTLGEITLANGVNLGSQSYGSDFALPAGATISYDLPTAGIYNFYAGGTKYRVAGFAFTPSEEASGTIEGPAERTQPAFPGAEGYGRYTVGGRGGTVYHVTTLEDTETEGSLRYALSQSGARTIVFDVSGIIHLTSELKISRDYVTIAGQTAVGGICIADYPVSIQANEVVIRFVNFRLGNKYVDYHEGDGLGGMDKRNWMIDHCSVSWSIDECLSAYGSTNTTVQWCIASHSLRDAGHSKGSHGYGGNWGGSGASYHHNLIANHTSRTPRLGPRPGTQEDERMDMRNNVMYNYGSNGCYGGEGMNVNIVNNYYKPGVVSNSRKARITGLGCRTVSYCFDESATLANYNSVMGTSATSCSVIRVNGVDGYNQLTINGKNYVIDMETSTIADGDKTVTVAWNSWKPMLHQWGTLFVDGNYNPTDAAVTADNWTTGIYSQITASSNDNYYNDSIKAHIKREAPVEYVYTTTHTANEAYELVLDYAGASLYRDEYDDIVVADVRKNSYSFGELGIIDTQDQVVYSDGHKGWPNYTETASPADTDRDGIPDDWEIANGLDPNDATDGNEVTASGYTNLEIYLNSLVADIMEAGNAGGKMLTGTLTYDDDPVELPAYGSISSVACDQPANTDTRIYNLTGILVNEPLAPGIYIQAGKKFVVR